MPVRPRTYVHGCTYDVRCKKGLRLIEQRTLQWTTSLLRSVRICAELPIDGCWSVTSWRAFRPTTLPQLLNLGTGTLLSVKQEKRSRSEMIWSDRRRLGLTARDPDRMAPTTPRIHEVREEEIREQQLRDLAAKAWTFSPCFHCSPTLLRCQARQQRAELASAPSTQSPHK